ncbi:hypothetical protein HME9302_00526 [Alteripontixanthobacter maritimus]|uniref:ABC-type uncharacterized transport system domain-containing protein n=1 Tax=Alteripontixanthobacter maritimus TaxID=2161824 RepID=A0A369Q8U1_9SPHN|nr:ABC transporter [Alteripontixanthobacter maritimus]RDC59339.1 hypothetical protein HME9302_00526 [Alteripontixanthobacter maritimus]
MTRTNSRIAIALGVLALAAMAVAGWGFATSRDGSRGLERERIGLMTSLPLYWPETRRFSDYLDDDTPPHWVRARLEERYRLEPLDTLAFQPIAGSEGTGRKGNGREGGGPLAGLSGLILAQPAGLTPAEYVALDNWVRGGGRVLVFADPMLTGHSGYPIGDPRRPQDAVLISPILTRWGLELTFDAAQAEGRSLVSLPDGAKLPVELFGTWLNNDPPGGEQVSQQGNAECSIMAEGLLADCAIGKGRALLIADAALLETPHEGEAGAREQTAFDALTVRAFQD